MGVTVYILYVLDSIALDNITREPFECIEIPVCYTVCGIG